MIREDVRESRCRRVAMKKCAWLVCLAVLGVLAGPAGAAEYRKAFESPKDWEATLYDWKIEVGPDGVGLLKTELVTDEMGITTAGMSEDVIGDTWIRKDFMLDKVQAASALLLIHFNRYVPADFKKDGGFLWVEVNGRAIKLEVDVPRMLTGGWVRCDVPVAYLVTGLNTVVIRNETKAPFYASLEASRAPNRSAKSIDGGKTWDYNRLGKDGFIDGEYLVRLRLGRYPDSAEILSDYLELAALVSDGPVKPAVRLNRIALDLEKVTPAGTSVALDLRGGTTPAYAPDSWTPWKPAAAVGAAEAKAWRFIQWRAALRTADRRATPVIRKLIVRADLDVTAGAAEGVKVAAYDNQRIVRGYYNFVFQHAAEPRLELLRSRYRLDEVVAHCATEFEKYRTLAFWMRGIWRDAWGKHGFSLHTPWDALISLELAPQYKASGMCVIYSNTFVQCALAVGLQARGNVLDHHFVSEVWSNEHKKWVTFDIAASTDSIRPAFHLKDGLPLNALETHTLAREGKKDQVWIVPAGPHPKINGADQKKENMLGPNEWEPRFGMPLRNNYLTSWLPGELEHGFIQYHYDGYLWWKDSAIPKYEEYTYQTSHARDFYWTINQAQIFLSATAKPAELEVQLDTVTPNFAGYKVRIDGGEWRDSGPEFTWTLHAGTNTIEAKPTNAFQLDGIISTVKIEY
jgi:hypothetical protein